MTSTMLGMPATFPAHPAAVLPLKLWRPAWFDGLALTVGSMAPDLAYALDGSPLERPFPGLAPLWQLAHSLPWFFACALPLTFALCPLLRLSAPAVATHLPASVCGATRVIRGPRGHADASPLGAASPAHRLRGHADASVRRAAGLVRRLRGHADASPLGAADSARGPRWYVTASSAGIGALSHVVWDRIAVGPLDLASSLLGGLICLWLLHRLMRRRPSTDPPARPAPGQLPDDGDEGRGRRPILFWGTFAAVLVSGGVFLPSLPGYFLAHTTSARVILLTVGAVVIAAAATSAVTAAAARLCVPGSRGKPLQQ